MAVNGVDIELWNSKTNSLGQQIQAFFVGIRAQNTVLLLADDNPCA